MRHPFVRTAAALLATGLLSGPALVAQEEPALRVTRAIAASAVEDREPVGESTAFPEGSEVVFWTLVEGGAEGGAIDHVWIREGEEVVTVGLAVGSARWRTWSRKTLHPGAAGAWTVEARDRDGRVLATVKFTCTAPSPGA